MHEPGGPPPRALTPKPKHETKMHETITAILVTITGLATTIAVLYNYLTIDDRRQRHHTDHQHRTLQAHNQLNRPR